MESEKDVLYKAIIDCGKDRATEMKSDPQSEDVVLFYDFIEHTSRFTLVEKIIDKLHSMGYQIK